MIYLSLQTLKARALLHTRLQQRLPGVQIMVYVLIVVYRLKPVYPPLDKLVQR